MFYDLPDRLVRTWHQERFIFSRVVQFSDATISDYWYVKGFFPICDTCRINSSSFITILDTVRMYRFYFQYIPTRKTGTWLEKDELFILFIHYLTRSHMYIVNFFYGRTKQLSLASKNRRNIWINFVFTAERKNWLVSFYSRTGCLNLIYLQRTIMFLLKSY